MLNFQNWSEWTDQNDVNIERVKTSDCSFKDGPGLKLHSFLGPAGGSALVSVFSLILETWAAFVAIQVNVL